MANAKQPRERGVGGAIFWDLLTFDRLLTGPVVHLIYWSGLGVVLLVSFGVIGAFVGFLMRGETAVEKLLALPVLVAGLLVVAAMALLWRAFCEFYVAIFRISDDLAALRQAAETVNPPRPAPAPPPA
ncbi:MAG TPA: DUF4282 domain-containing protein [Caulobacteraceae bacterium]|nr:DUF4282 domain-containing protein [Caulobacteraceae bacterium]